VPHLGLRIAECIRALLPVGGPGLGGGGRIISVKAFNVRLADNNQCKREHTQTT
jgi:hypothetical protein